MDVDVIVNWYVPLLIVFLAALVVCALLKETPLTFAERTFTYSVAASFALSQDEKSAAEVKAVKIKKGNLTEIFILRFVSESKIAISQGILLNSQTTIYY